MRTLIVLAVGFWLGRQIYIRYDKAESQKREEELQNRINRLLPKGKFDPTARGTGRSKIATVV